MNTFATTVKRLAHSPLRILPKKTAIPIFSGPARGCWWCPRSSDVTSFWRGSFEPYETEVFARHVVPGMVVYDIGAHVGYYTLIAARRVGQAGRVYAFEPAPSSFSALRRHVMLNGFHDRVTLYEGAVADATGLMPFWVKPGVMESMLDPSGTHFVQAYALDGLHIRPPSVIKLDAESAELLVLKGAERTIREHRPTIFLSVHTPETRVESLRLLGEWGYHWQPLDGLSADESWELLATTGH